MNQAQLEQVKSGKGFIAALDQSGGSTPRALRLYGVQEEAYSNDDEMFAHIHQMRSRIVEAPAFNGDKVLGAILFEMTMDRQIGGKPTAQTLWDEKRVVPFLKCDKGLMDQHNGVQILKPIDGLDTLLDRAIAAGIFGTKMRSVISAANKDGIESVVAQQFEIAKQIIAKGLVPIIEPEVDVTIADKAEAEDLLLASLIAHLDALDDGQDVILKLSLPDAENHYAECMVHPRVIRVVALSGGFNRAEATKRLAQNAGMIASFSRALTEGLDVSDTDDAFNAKIATTIDDIYTASIT